MTESIPRIDPDEADLLGVFPRDGAWGHRTVFDDWEGRDVYGWYSGANGEFAEDGDRFGYEMESQIPGYGDGDG